MFWSVHIQYRFREPICVFAPRLALDCGNLIYLFTSVFILSSFFSTWTSLACYRCWLVHWSPAVINLALLGVGGAAISRTHIHKTAPLGDASIYKIIQHDLKWYHMHENETTRCNEPVKVCKGGHVFQIGCAGSVLYPGHASPLWQQGLAGAAPWRVEVHGPVLSFASP